MRDLRAGFNGWALHNVRIHNNVMTNVTYGTNTDALKNRNVTIDWNTIDARAWGIVIGVPPKNIGPAPFTADDFSFDRFTVQNNSITSRTVGVLLNGRVTNSTVTQNKIHALAGKAVVEVNPGNSGNTTAPNVTTYDLSPCVAA
jgi:hypothetical protein